MIPPPTSGPIPRTKAISYDAIFFDFDGVLVESAAIKTQAFRALYAGQGEDVVAHVLAHHMAHEGISRVEKIHHCHLQFLGQDLSDPELAALAGQYSEMVVEAVVGCPAVAGSLEFLQRNVADKKMFVVSGTPQTELRDIVDARGMTHYFQEVCGSPRRKEPIVTELLHRYDLAAGDCLFIGDAMTDHRAARATGLDFIGRVGPNEDNPFPEGTTVIGDLTELSD